MSFKYPGLTRRKSCYGIDVEEQKITENKDESAVLVRIDRPCHKFSESLLNCRDNNELSYRGFFNLMLVLFHILYGRLAIENILSYGSVIRSNPFDIILVRSYSNPALRLLMLIIPFLLSVFGFEKLLSKRKIPVVLGRSIQIATLIAMISTPIAYVPSNKMLNPIPYGFVCLIYVAMLLKCFSYVHINHVCGSYTRKHKVLLMDEINKVKVIYPSNVTLADFAYFLAAPTLCYELSYPTSPRIRPQFIVRELFETTMCLTLQILIVQKWIGPLLKKSTIPLLELDFPQILDELMRLAVPTHLSWLIFFYVTFHSFPNVTAEILRFGDREFYLDWWNAEDISEFWRKWNTPVHRWAKRHVYKPLLQIQGFPKAAASIAVFLISAVFHEYIVSVPLSICRFWFFLGMGAQIPLSYIVRQFKGDRGNMAVWLTIVMGIPMIIIAYIYEYVVMHRDLVFAQ